ncbi:family 43 glycosylhydrolase [Lentzea sp. DG1S-22]|uniref:glycoside hydrolase family 43 protein n=1 Tax=Lentzea sp. DG1S-22 TaxID=3108822 RepID=UPI002E7A6DB9|nr:family 43 glycosylhydrolase [Lentzea sp. DG1S-22]WVH82713.1 family 43 glycosylhydrolase [Lentzea sp. DG1S-22]
MIITEKSEQLTTPIIAGFFPDPSICRAGNAYYLANSSFEYAPGVPIHRSTDLVTWTPVGNALHRPSQLDVRIAPASTGVYAPTLRHHGDKFWMVTTNVLEHHRGQLIVTADDPAGPWSDPVHVDGAIGIDPDLMWDEDGVCHLTWASNLPGIASMPIDPATGTALGSPRLLWQGTGLAHPEGPHLYRRDGWWYLVLAEGGTERGHTVTVARATSLAGPWEAAPTNPILTHRSTTHPVQNTGHADLVELADGSWAVVYLGVRPRGRTPMFHVNGRETFIAGVTWIDGWPVVDEERFAPAPPDYSFVDRFDSTELDHRWVSPNVFPDAFTRLEGGRLVLTAPAEGDPKPVLSARARDPEWTAEVRLDTSAGIGRFLVRIDESHWYGLTADAETVTATVVIGPAHTPVAQVPLRGRATLRISVREPVAVSPMPVHEPDLIELAVMADDGTPEVLGTFDGRYLSTEVAGGFTGRTFGVEPVAGEVAVHHISYRSLG